LATCFVVRSHLLPALFEALLELEQRHLDGGDRGLGGTSPLLFSRRPREPPRCGLRDGRDSRAGTAAGTDCCSSLNVIRAGQACNTNNGGCSGHSTY
jgi:hypothetical protein